MSADKKVPEIRFKGFSGEWENKKIGRLLTEIKRPIELMDNTSYQLVTVKRRNEGVVPRAILKGKNILVKNYFSVEAGDYLISKRQVVHGANGIVPDYLDGAVVSNEYLVVTDSDDITARYWTVISIRPEMHKLFFVSSYGVDIEKLVFDVTDWKNRTIVIPEVTEQKKITDYFQKLDTLIKQHQQKHDKLSNIKKAMLEKMFPKPGETIPEIRFKEFSGEWEHLTIGDCSSLITKGTTPMTIGKNFVDRGITFVKVECVDEIGNLNPAKFAYIDNETDQALARSRIKENDLLVSIAGALGRAAIVKKEILPANTNQALAIVRLKNDSPIGINFLYHFTKSRDFKEFLDETASQGAQPNLSLGDISKLRILAPKKEEQTAIGNYFHKLDALINQHQQQITKFNNIKQACLSKMFV